MSYVWSLCILLHHLKLGMLDHFRKPFRFVCSLIRLANYYSPISTQGHPHLILNKAECKSSCSWPYAPYCCTSNIGRFGTHNQKSILHTHFWAQNRLSKMASLCSFYSKDQYRNRLSYNNFRPFGILDILFQFCNKRTCNYNRLCRICLV